MEKFIVKVAPKILTDLRQRLNRTRYPEDLGNDDWAYGTHGRALRQLCDYWRDGFDWRAVERAINRFPHFRTDIGGNPIHFIQARGKGPKPMPIILNHGWPWTFWDMHKLIGPLSDPAAHGGDAADAFDVVVPSLPGYGFSTPLARTGLNFWNTADLWVTLMQQTLGYDRFGSYGGDWGALITAQLGHKYADHLTGIYVSLPLPLDVFLAPFPGPELYAADESDWYDANQRFVATESGYSALLSTKPQTLAYALTDSPVGHCAWILEKRRSWSDCGGDVERVFSKDELLTTVMLYWITASGGSAGRYYYECLHNPWSPSHDRHPRVEAPTGIAQFEREVVRLPKAWSQQTYNLQRYRRFARGGHFAPMEQPEVLIHELREFFRPLRR